MIGTPTVSSAAQAAYYIAICLALMAFSIYDIKTKRVPNWALASFIPIVLCVLAVSDAPSFLIAFLRSLLGGLCGFGILLAAGLASKGGAGIGGGDIKLAGLVGFAFGPYGVTIILLLAALLSAPVCLFFRLHQKSGPALHIPFVPFITAGCLFVTAANLLSLS